jgi:hypothetical protein
MAHRSRALFIDPGDEDKLDMALSTSTVVIKGETHERDAYIIFQNTDQALAFADKMTQAILIAMREKE